MRTSLDAGLLDTIIGPLRRANLALAAAYPGESGLRQPVHTVYGGANLWKAGTAKRSGEIALASLTEYAPDGATLGRVLGIPARVAIGFLSPEPDGPHTWVYSSHDMHAWPELYFQGSGWVRFEPTPASQAPDVPAYTSGQLPELDQTEAPSPTAAPTSAAHPSRWMRPRQSSGPGAPGRRRCPAHPRRSTSQWVVASPRSCPSGRRSSSGRGAWPMPSP